MIFQNLMVLFSIVLLCYRECDHDSLISHQYHPLLMTQKRINQIKSLFREPIRIFVDTFRIEQPDSFACINGDETITWGGKTVKCTNNDLINDAKKNVIIATSNNVIRFIQSFLSVNRFSDPIPQSSWPGIAYVEEKLISGCDLVLNLFPRPYGATSSTLASAGAILFESNENRPVQGMVFFNVATLPESSQDANSEENEFFMTVFHEICHVLGISQSMFSKWRDSLGFPYDPFPKTEIQEKGKTFTIIHTPNAHKYALKRFGVETFSFSQQSCPSGIEFEDGGGSGTRGSHPEGRVFFGEVMVGLTTGESVISDLTMSLLADTGWYDVNYSYAKGLSWGNGNALDKTPLTNFPVKPPQESFPSHYLCQPDETQDICTHDFKSHGYCYSGIELLSQPYEVYQAGKAFYNPNNYSIIGLLWVYDFQLIKVKYANRDCTKSTSQKIFESEEFGSSSRCFMADYIGSKSPMCFATRCDGDSLFITVDKSEKECKYENQELTFGYYTLKCPKPHYVCRISQIDGISQPPTDTLIWKSLDVGGIAVSSIFGTIALLSNRNQRVESDNSNF